MASNGYGKFKYKGRVVLAHRMSYAIYRGPVPAGMTVNHTFKPKGCNAPFPRDCNPDNLELLSHAANVAEGNERGGYRGVVKKIMLQRVENAEIDVFMCPRCNGSMVARQGHIFICLNCDHKLKESEVRTEDIIPF
jgi:ribosomal protein L37AE/L43A